VFEWLTWAASELALVTDEKLAHLNSHLATRTFLAGNRTSLADLVVFGTIHPAVVSGPLLVSWCWFLSTHML
jgi:glutathione S-transferase